MTLEELRLVPFEYTFGYSAADHALRQYVNRDLQIAMQMITPKNPETGVWGVGKPVYKDLITGDEFDDLAGLLGAINKRDTS
jgi:hypothetical protein